jgi:hypothetical protein
MKFIDIDQFAKIAYRLSLVNVYLGVEAIETVPLLVWARLEAGPVLACFGDECVLFRQPIGECQVEIILASIEECASLIKEDLPDSDTETAFVQITANVSYPNDSNDSPSSISRITTYQNQDNNKIVGIILELTTGSSIGLDASSYGGISLFFDGQAASFQRNIVDALSLHEKVISK